MRYAIFFFSVSSFCSPHLLYCSIFISAQALFISHKNIFTFAWLYRHHLSNKSICYLLATYIEWIKRLLCSQCSFELKHFPIDVGNQKKYKQTRTLASSPDKKKIQREDEIHLNLLCQTMFQYQIWTCVRWVS